MIEVHRWRSRSASLASGLPEREAPATIKIAELTKDAITKRDMINST